MEKTLLTTPSKSQFFKGIKTLLTIGLLHFFVLSSAQCPINGDSLVCKGAVGNYSTNFTGLYNYQWNAFGGVVSGAGTAVTVSWNIAGTGQVTLVVRDPANNVVCTSVMNVQIRNNPQPLITPSYSVACGPGGRTDGGSQGDRKDENPCINVCDSTWVQYSVSNNPGSSYTWIVTGSANYTPSNSATLSVYWTGIGSGTVRVIETDSFGCIGEHQICVNIVGKPQALFSSPTNPIVGGQISICLNQYVNLNNLSIPGNGSPLYKYEWIWGDGNITTQDPPSPFASHQYTSPGTYTLHLVALNECRCRDTFSVTVVVDSLPGPDIFCISTVCPDQTVSYYTSSSCPTYNWTVSNGFVVGGGGANDSFVTILWGTVGPGVISLSTPGCSGNCAATTSVYVPIITPTATVAGPSLLCIGDVVKYKISCSIPIDSIQWNIPNGLTVMGSTTNVHEVSVMVTDSFVSGNISVNYYHHVPGSTSGLSCGGSAVLSVMARPKLQLSAQSEICEGDAFSVFPFQNNFQPISGNIQWTVTDITGANTFLLSTLPGTTPFSIPNWTYGPGSFYIQANGLNNQFCNNPQKKLLQVNPAPAPPDSIKGPSPVCPSRPYTYLAYPTASNFAIEWNVSDGNPASMGGNTISVLWNATGTYILQAFQVNPITGCRSLPLNDTILSILPLTGSVIAGFDTVCANTPGTVYSINDPGDLFTWSISPSLAGSVVAGQGSNAPSINWNNWTGNATITVIRSICGQTVTSTKTVHVRNPPPPALTVPATVCQGAIASMSTSTVGVSYNWSFGDGGTGSGNTVSHTYNAPGTYFVTLTVNYGAGCVSSASVSSSIIVRPRPTVSISTPNPTRYCGTVGLVNMYIADPAIGTSYQWFQSPPPTPVGSGDSFSTNTIGTYYAVATNAFGCQTTSNLILIDTLCDTCIHAPVSLGFTQHRQGCSRDSFSGTHGANGFNPHWYLDDIYNFPNTASGLNPVHTFSEPGYYRVQFCVNVLANNGVDTCLVCTTRVDTVKYKPDFYYTLNCSGSGFSVNLVNNTKRIATLPVPPYQWNISPGSFSSTAANPSVNLAPGNYTATLTVDGVCVISKPIVVPPLPAASFTIVDSTCVGTPVAYTNTSIGASTFTWYFGDGASSLTNNPLRTFDFAGSYTSKLVLSNAYGCADSTTRTVVVMPNTLTGNIAPSDTSLCEGDSVQYVVTPMGGYPAYTYLWSSVQSGPSIWAKYTGSYFVDIRDSKGCFFRTAPVQVLVNPVPKPEIQGPLNVCLGDMAKFGVNYPSSGGYVIAWNLQPNNWPGSGSTFQVGGFGLGLGTKTLTVSVTGPTGCVGYDTFVFVVRNNPIATITPLNFPLCEGTTNILLGASPSPNIVHTFWNNGWPSDTLSTNIPDNYTFTVVDTFGCKGTAQITINPLPSFCGYQSGCYEICDTVSLLIWHAPPGHMTYQWFYNGNPLAGATSDTLHIPLYQSGTYHVQVTSFAGCVASSDPTDISFVKCLDCKWEMKDTVRCGKLSANGSQTYNVTLSLFNNLGLGAGVSIVPQNGSISGLSPLSLTAGWNALTFAYLPNPSATTHCFTVITWLNDSRCDTVYCIKLPPCDLKPCSKQVSIKEIVCEGYDNAGNPLYSVCSQVVWGGPTGTMMTVNVSSGSVSPNTFSLITGSQTLCFTFTDLPPYGSPSMFYFSFFDSVTNESCRDSVKAEHKPCPEDCKFNVYNNCAHCELSEPGFTNYSLDMIIDNPFPGNATVTVLPIVAGSFGPVTPGIIGPGLQSVQIPFTDNLPKDTFICFTVVLTDAFGKKCTRQVCMYLPPCDKLSVKGQLALRSNMKLAPNPSHEFVQVFYNTSEGKEVRFEILDMTGRTLLRTENARSNGVETIRLEEMAAGTYLIRMIADNRNVQTQRLVIAK